MLTLRLLLVLFALLQLSEALMQRMRIGQQLAGRSKKDKKSGGGTKKKQVASTDDDDDDDDKKKKNSKKGGDKKNDKKNNKKSHASTDDGEGGSDDEDGGDEDMDETDKAFASRSTKDVDDRAKITEDQFEAVGGTVHEKSGFPVPRPPSDRMEMMARITWDMGTPIGNYGRQATGAVNQRTAIYFKNVFSPTGGMHEMSYCSDLRCKSQSVIDYTVAPHTPAGDKEVAALHVYRIQNDGNEFKEGAFARKGFWRLIKRLYWVNRLPRRGDYKKHYLSIAPSFIYVYLPNEEDAQRLGGKYEKVGHELLRKNLKTSFDQLTAYKWKNVDLRATSYRSVIGFARKADVGYERIGSYPSTKEGAKWDVYFLAGEAKTDYYFGGGYRLKKA